MLVCLYEDRPHQMTGLKLLVLSLHRYCPDWPIRIHAPGITSDRRQWFENFPHVQLIDKPLPGGGSYNVKPAALLDGLDAGAEMALWLDTDVIVNGPLAFIEEAPLDTVCVSQDPWEYAMGSTYRCSSWGVKAGRELAGPLNSAALRITKEHRSLLEAWKRILTLEAYQTDLKKPAAERNAVLLGDQDGLSALLASEEFSDIPIRLILHASEILQHHGAGAYNLRHRTHHLTHGLPPLLHAMGTIKPWLKTMAPSALRSPRDYYETTYLDLSPYMHVARQYRAELHEDTRWMDSRTAAASLFSLGTLGHPALKGAAQALLHRYMGRKTPVQS